MIYKLGIIAILFICGSAVRAQTEKQMKLLAQFKYEKDIVYKIIDDDTLDMILFLPRVKKFAKTPIMLHTHGGGWGGGDKYKILQPVFLGTLRKLLENGIACASIEYRLTRTGKSTAYDCVVDCKDAARYLVRNAEKYSLDPNCMGVWGGSAGGHLSLMTALGDNNSFIGDELLSAYNPRFRCVASYFPLTSFIEVELLKDSNFENAKRFIPLLGGLLSEKEELAKALSPIELLKKDSPPILLLHGEDDKILPFAQSENMMERAYKIGANVQLYEVKDAGHSFNGENISPSMEQINQFAADFIIRNLINNNSE